MHDLATIDASNYSQLHVHGSGYGRQLHCGYLWRGDGVLPVCVPDRGLLQRGHVGTCSDHDVRRPPRGLGLADGVTSMIVPTPGQTVDCPEDTFMDSDYNLNQCVMCDKSP